MTLADRHCIAPRQGDQPLNPSEAEELKKQIHDDWELGPDCKTLKRVFRFRNFKDTMTLGVKIGEIAEQENHHPDLLIAWGRLEVLITTHKIKGLAESDFIFAAKVDETFSQPS